MWYLDKLQEHLEESSPCNSQFNGYDRGDDAREDYYFEHDEQEKQS